MRRRGSCGASEGGAEGQLVLLGDAGVWYRFATIEYAIGTIAAAAFGAILYGIVTGDSIVGALTKIINRAPHTRV